MSVTLRPLREADLRCIYDWQRDPDLYDHLVGERREVNWEEAREWMVRHWLPQGRDRRYALCVDREMVGCVYLLADDDAPAEPAFHIFIGDATRRGQGIGRAALAAALRAAFEDLRVDAVRLEVLADNTTARRIYQTAGFQQTGRRAVTKRRGGTEAIAMRLSADAYRAR